MPSAARDHRESNDSQGADNWWTVPDTGAMAPQLEHSPTRRWSQR